MGRLSTNRHPRRRPGAAEATDQHKPGAYNPRRPLDQRPKGTQAIGHGVGLLKVLAPCWSAADSRGAVDAVVARGDGVEPHEPQQPKSVNASEQVSDLCRLALQKAPRLSQR